MGVKLSSVVGGFQVQHGLVKEGNDLEVGRRAEELNTLDGARGDDTRTTAGLGTPCNLLTLRIRNGGRASSGSPHTPV